jgi:DNA helicase-2/ATP-dependent DNA helicase PcrA
VAGETRLANLQELVNGAALYGANPEGLADFLEHIALDRAIEQEEDGGPRVTLITLHNTKGLEFRRVIMTGLEQGLFPRGDKESDDLEEERRLFYVGATRAMDELYLTSCAYRRMYGRTEPMEPSLFLEEADLSKVRVVGTPPYGFTLPAAGKSGKASGRSGTGKSATADRSNYGAAPVSKAAGAAGRRSSDGRWQVGDRLFNEDRGYGEVIAIQENDEAGPIISVHYENGYFQRFLSRGMSSRFMKVGE